jgi:Lrp/AsnC family leucine-responsive transcriptional regulator
MAYQLDSIDIKILDLLQENARLTSKQIGDKLHKSVSTIYDRIHRLERENYITRYAAILNNLKVGHSLVAFTHVQLKDHSEESLNLFEDQIIKFEEVMECYHMSGQYDFILKVATTDLPAYHDFLMNHLFKVVAVASVLSTFVMKEAKYKTMYRLMPNA